MLKICYFVRLAVLLGCIVFVLISYPIAAGAKEDIASVGAPFLRIGPGARATAMAGAFAAVSDDASASYWNPAGLVNIERLSLQTSHAEWFQDVRYEYVALAGRRHRSAFASSIFLLHMGELEERKGPSKEPIGSFSAYDLVATGSYALGITRNLALGATGKFIFDKIHSSTAHGLALDLGISSSPLPNVTVAAGIKNLSLPSGSRLSYPDKLPTTVVAGVSTVLFSSLMLTGELDYFTYRKPEVKVGGEWWPHKAMALRAGYKYDTEPGGENGLAIGAGLRVGIYELDYAYAPNRAIGDTHHISLQIKINEPSSPIIWLVQGVVSERKTVLLTPDISDHPERTEVIKRVKTGDLFVVYRVPKEAEVERTLIAEVTTTKVFEAHIRGDIKRIYKEGVIPQKGDLAERE